MRFQKSITALFVGALVFGPTTGAFADDSATDRVTGAGGTATTETVTEAPKSDAQTLQANEPEVEDANADKQEAPEADKPKVESEDKQDSAPADENLPADKPEDAAITTDVDIIAKGKQPKIVAVGTKLAAKVPAGLHAKSLTWTVAGKKVVTGANYTVKKSDAGKKVTVKADFTGVGHAQGKTVVDATVAAKAKAKVSTTAKISGTPKVGKKLTAKTATVKAPKGVKVSKKYTWYANGKKVATGKKYTVKKSDVKKRISVRAGLTWKSSKTYFEGKATSKASKKTAKITKQTAKVKAKTKVKGSAKAGKKLVAVGSVKKPKALKVKTSYTWYVSGKKVKSGKSLKVKSWMSGRKVSVVYKAKWTGGGVYKASGAWAKKSFRVASDRPTRMVRSAYSQLGAIQDCTVLIERALRAAGVKHVGDLGTQAYEYTNLGGKRVSGAHPKPGDVFVWSGRHVAMYIGNGMAIHSGYAGNHTVKASAYLDGAPNAIVRF